MKRIFSLLLASALFLSLLSACRQPSVTESDPLPSASVDEALSAQELVNAVYPYSGCKEAMEAESLNAGVDKEQLAANLENSYSLDAGTWADAAILRSTGASAFELSVIRFADEAAARAGAERLEDYLVKRQGDFSGYAPVEADMVANARIRQEGAWLGLFVCPNPEGAENAFQSALNGEVPPAVSPEPAVSKTPAGIPTLIEINWRMPEGEADPDYPDRIKFSPPGDEDMSIYDTSAIRAAWAAGDPSPLSDYDREIYNAAKAALDEILADGMSDYDKEVAVYAWVVQNVNYNYSHIPGKPADDSFRPYGGLVNREAVCIGYAATFQLLADLAGLECVTVVGAGSSSELDHAWNMVRLNGDWYCLDATWDANARESELLPDGWTWRFFNVTSDYMAQSNHQWDYSAIPEAVTEGHGQG